MTRIYPSVDRLEARIDHQAARIDALYRMLEERGLIPAPADAGKTDAFFDEPLALEDAPLARESRAEGTRLLAARFRVGEATGV